MKTIIGILLISMLLSCQSVEKKGGYFNQTPSKFKLDSLRTGSDLIGDLVFEDVGSKGEDVVKVSNSDCITIPFCGYLSYKRDTVFHSATKAGLRKPFLILKAKKFSKWVVEYRHDRIDEVTYLGMRADESDGDSLHLFMLQPTKLLGAIDSEFLKFIAIKKGGIRHLSFYNYAHLFTIRLQEYPKVIFEE